MTKVIGGWWLVAGTNQSPTTVHQPPTTTMITRLARKKFTEMIRDGRSRWVAAIILTLLTVSLQFRPVEDATPFVRFGELTAATMLQVLWPLLIILLGYNAFAGEREGGTLRQLLRLGISKTQLTLGKAQGASNLVPQAPRHVVATVGHTF